MLEASDSASKLQISPPLLVVYCSKDRITSSYVFFPNNFFSPNRYVQTELFIDGKLRRETWIVSREGHHVGKFGPQMKAISFVKSLFSHSNLRVDFKDEQLPKNSISFEIAGTQEAVAEIRKACNW